MFDVDVERQITVGHEPRVARIEQPHTAIKRRRREREIEIGFVSADLRGDGTSEKNEDSRAGKQPAHQTANSPSDVQQTVAPDCKSPQADATFGFDTMASQDVIVNSIDMPAQPSPSTDALRVRN